MRDYQVQGLNWMASLHHNGINGILADEMVRGDPDERVDKLILDLSSGSWEDTANHRISRVPQVPSRHTWTASYRRAQINAGQLDEGGNKVGTRLQRGHLARCKGGSSGSSRLRREQH